MNREKVIVALDFDLPEEAVKMAERIAPVFPFFKVGMKLFTKAGPSLVHETLRHGKVFLDLKFYDIPSIVSEAVSQAAQPGVSLLTIHASGGSEMMKRCAEKLQSRAVDCRLLGVTVLTSMDSLDEFGLSRTVPEQVHLLARLAHSSGVHGIVCSPAELKALRPAFPSPFLLVTPGIRDAAEDKGDQKRTASAREALQGGADFIVIGRPIIAAADPVLAAERIAREIE